MNVHQLMVELSRQDVKMSADGDELRIRAPQGALTQELRDALSNRKSEILSLLRKRDLAELTASSPLKPARRPKDGRLPLSFIQEQLWFLNQFNPESPAYNLPGAMRLEGPLDVAALRQAHKPPSQRFRFQHLL